MKSNIYTEGKFFPNFVLLRIKAILKFLFTASVVVLIGCSGTSYKVDPKLISTFEEPDVPTDKTGLYVIRGSNFQGGARGLWVAVNDAVVADLSNGSHVYLELDADFNTLHFVQGMAGMGYLAVDNRPGEIVYASFDYGGTAMTTQQERDMGQTMVMKTSSVDPLEETRPNNAYDNLLVNPGLLDYPIMIEATEELTADAEYAVVRFYRPDKLIKEWAFDIWNQDGYLGSTKGGAYFSVKLKPGNHDFISLSESFSILEAELEANKEYAVELNVGMGWNQAHIKLLPIDISSSDGQKKIDQWQAKLASTVLSEETTSLEPVEKRLELGYQFLADQRKAITNEEVSKRSLPAAFGK